MKRGNRKEWKERMAQIKANNRKIWDSGKCPVCGSALRQNLALTGWIQCEQYGAEGFRKDSSKAACDFQMLI